MNKILYDKHIALKSMNIYKLGFRINSIGFSTYFEELYIPLSYEMLKHWKFHFYIYAAEMFCNVK